MKKKNGNPNLFIIDVKKGKPFTKVANEEIEDDDLSWSSRGIFNYITSRPPNWVLRRSDIQAKSYEGETVVRRAMNQLSQLGYLHKIQKREGGKIKQWGYIAAKNPITDDEEVKNYIKKHCPDWELYKDNKSTRCGNSTCGDPTCGNSTCGETPPLNYTYKEVNKTDRNNTNNFSKEKLNRRKLDEANASPNFGDGSKVGLIRRAKPVKTTRERIFEKQAEIKSRTLSPYEKMKKNKGLKRLFDKWYSLVLPEYNKQKKHYSELKCFDKALKLLRKATRGTLFKDLSPKDEIFHGTELYKAKFTLSDIEECMDLHIEALKPENNPVRKDFLKIHLDQFLLNPFGGIKSYLAYWTMNDVVPVVQLDEIDNEDLFESIIEELGWDGIPNKDKNKLILFLNKHNVELMRLRINPIYYRDKNAFAKGIIDGISQTFNNKPGFTITPGLFSNDNLFKWTEENIKNAKWFL